MNDETNTNATPAPQAPASPPPTAPETAQTVTAAELAGAVTMPEPSERAIETAPADSNANQTPSNPTPTPQAGARDKTGRKFNPAKHAPRMTPAGRWAPRPSGRRIGRPKKGETSFVPVDTPPAPPIAPPAAPTSDRFDLAAELYCRTGYSLADGIFAGNGEWLPESDGEHLAIKQAVAAYLRHKNSEDLPPGWALALAIAGYGAGRLAKPNTQRRIATLTNWIGSKLRRQTAAGELRAITDAAPPAAAAAPIQTANPTPQ